MKKKNRIKETKTSEYYIDSSYVNLDNKDYLENYIYSDELNNKISNYFNSDNKKPLYIGIIGTWGSGKTSVVETALEKQNKNVIIFRYDAWKYEGDSFRRSFIQSILNQSVELYNMKTNNKVYKNISESLYEDYSISSNSITERLKLSSKKDKKLSITSIIITTVALILVVGLGIYNIYNNNIAVGNIITLLGAMGIFDIFYSTTVYSKSKLFSSEQFYKSFIDILNKVNGDKNIILIDNLDRCNTDNLKQTLNIIKGFYVENNEIKLKNEKIIFIIPLDIDYLKSDYKEHTIYYLDKIFDDMIYIKTKYNTDKLDFINRILKEYPDINALINSESKSIIVNSIINTPREIIKTINDYVTEYNILFNKTNKEFVENNDNRSFLMKTIILKRRYYDFYQLAFNNIEEFIKIERRPSVTDELKKYNNYDELIKFLTISASISPTNYYEFFQNQTIKSYNQIPINIKTAIMESDVETILKYKEKNKIINYYNNIYDDIENGFWNINILHKYITLIELYKNNYFSGDEFSKIMISWEIVFRDSKFQELNNNNMHIIGYENELIFGTEMYKNVNFNMSILDCLNDNTYKLESEQEKYEKLSRWLIKNQDLSLNEKYTNLLNSYCEYLLNNELYSNDEYLNILYSSNIKIISIDKIRRIITKNNNNTIVLKILNNIKKEEINDNQMVNEFVKWLSYNEINDINIIISILDYLINNNRDISMINISNLNINEPVNVEDILNIINKYTERKIYNNTLFKILKTFKGKTIIQVIISNLANNVPDNNNEYITHFIDYFFELSIEIKKDNLKELVEVVNKYHNYEENILGRLINDELLKNYYNCLVVSEDRERTLNISMKLISKDFDKQMDNIFIYESSIARMKELISNHNTICEYALIINKVNKKSIKEKLISNFIEIINDKDNIIDEEINAIKSLNIDIVTKEKINEILNTKETINKALVGT
ncbi:MAG: P-loop NTPase fold protein [Bacilli bacterium]